MKTMRPLLVLMLMLGAVGQANAQRKVNERRAAKPSGVVRIFLLAGQVNVIGWDQDSLVVTGTVHERPGEPFSVGVTPQGAKLGLWSEREEGLAPSTITVHVPRRSQVWVKTTSGNINVRGVTGAVDLFSVSGSIVAGDAPRALYAETMAGEIVTDVTTSSARLKTASGVIKSGGSIGDLAAVSVSGDINASLTTFGRARLESVDGQIRYYGVVPPASVLDIINHAGAITMVIPAKTSADFAFNLYEADLNDEFGIKKRWMTNNNFRAQEMTFGLGDRPTARVTIRSFKGAVAIRRLEGAK